jgi:hypothetical protein
MKYFYNKPWFLMISGGINNDTHAFSNVVSNSGGLADTAIFPNCIITGATGLYTVTIQNVAGQTNHNHAFTVTSGINKSQLFVISTNSSIVDSNGIINALDYNLNTYQGIVLPSNSTEKYFTLTAKLNKVVDFSLIKVLMNNLPTASSRTPNPSGIIRMYYKNQSDSTPFFTTGYSNLSGAIISNTNFTGVSRIRIVGATGVTLQYLGISEFEIY